MFNDYKIVCVTAAGRRRYMQYLVPQVLASPIVDRYDIWVHTMDLCDIEFFKSLESHFSQKVRLVWQPEHTINGLSSINSFYRECVDEQSIYIKLDDDILWMDPDFFEDIVKFRVSHPEYLFISPLVINNAKSTYILQVREKLILSQYQDANSFGSNTWQSPDFALELHNWFFQNYLKTGQYPELYCGSIPIGITRFSINCIVWMGRDMKQNAGLVIGDDEEYLSSILPTRFGRSNCFYCDTIVVHFAFGPQRPLLDNHSILSVYGEWIRSSWQRDSEMISIDRIIRTILTEIETNRSTILSQSHPYTEIPPSSTPKTFRQHLFSFFPSVVDKFYLRARTHLGFSNKKYEPIIKEPK